MKNKLKLFLITTLTLLLAACGSETSGGDETGLNLVEDGKFVYAASGEFAPFSVTEEDGKMSGFDIDVAEAIAKKLDLDPEQKKFKFAGIVEGVKTGRFDAAVASHTITDERLEQVNFSTPYYYSGPQIFVRPDSDVLTLADLEGMEIAVSKGSTYEETAAEVTDKIQRYDSDVVALEALNNGKHDAVITDFITGKEAMGAGLTIDARELIGRSDQGIAINKENKELLEKINKALEELREEGKLKEISEKYFGEDITTDPEKE
ncbi:transporter substrate-binding domain-containing protein [Bacillus sp. 2205SS5-2]|uniref:transporter substrate-binding domain-containing protein n=1 Tax=Bacillus sp. 2205SS5-2 TaxID=3109031 RepID=UPI0030040F7B